MKKLSSIAFFFFSTCTLSNNFSNLDFRKVTNNLASCDGAALNIDDLVIEIKTPIPLPMKTHLYSIENNNVVPFNHSTPTSEITPQVVLAFGNKEFVSKSGFYEMLKAAFPNAEIAISSTSGEIRNIEVTDDGAVITAMSFDKTPVSTGAVQIQDHPNSFQAGHALAAQFNGKNVNYLLVLSDGALVNGSELIAGIEYGYSGKICVTGGLAGDGSKFQSTAVGLNNPAGPGTILAIGFSGDNLKVGHGVMGGWDAFGPERVITKSESNVLFEIDDKSALNLYKEYLGKFADELPGSALLFPLCITSSNDDGTLVRTILSIDQEKESLTFAGDMPMGAKVRFMTANFDRIIDAASVAAFKSFDEPLNRKPDYALLISCVGRKLILNNRVDEEVEAVSNTFGKDTVLSGFYSYGELSPFNEGSKCQLHNQTMTITTFTEL